MAITASRSFTAPSGGPISIKVNTGYYERLQQRVKFRYDSNSQTSYPDADLAAHKWRDINPRPVDFEVDLSMATFDTTSIFDRPDTLATYAFDAVVDGFENRTPAWDYEAGVDPDPLILESGDFTGHYHDPTLTRLQAFWSFGDTGHWTNVADDLPAEYSQKDYDLGIRTCHTYTDAAMTAAGSDYVVKVLVYEPSSGKVATATTTVNVKNYLYEARKIILVNNETVADGGVAGNEDFSAFDATRAALEAEWLADGVSGDHEIIERNLKPFVIRPNQMPTTKFAELSVNDDSSDPDYQGADYGPEFNNDPWGEYRSQGDIVWLLKGYDEGGLNTEYRVRIHEDGSSGSGHVYGAYGAGKARINERVAHEKGVISCFEIFNQSSNPPLLNLKDVRIRDWELKGAFTPETDLVSENGNPGMNRSFTHLLQEGWWMTFYNCDWDGCGIGEGIWRVAKATGVDTTHLPGGTNRLSLVSCNTTNDGTEYMLHGSAEMDIIGTKIISSPDNLMEGKKFVWDDGPSGKDPADGGPEVPDTPFTVGEYIYDMSQTPAGTGAGEGVRAKIIKQVDLSVSPFGNDRGRGYFILGRPEDATGQVFPDVNFTEGAQYRSSVDGVYVPDGGITCTNFPYPSGGVFWQGGDGAIRNSLIRCSNTANMHFSKSRFLVSHVNNGQTVVKIGNTAALGSFASFRFCIFESPQYFFQMNAAGKDYSDYKSVKVQCCIGIGTVTTEKSTQLQADGFLMENFVAWYPSWDDTTESTQGKRPSELLSVAPWDGPIQDTNSPYYPGRASYFNVNYKGGPIEVNGMTGVCNWTQANRPGGTGGYNGSLNNNHAEKGELSGDNPLIDPQTGSTPGGTYLMIKNHNVLTQSLAQTVVYDSCSPVDGAGDSATTLKTFNGGDITAKFKGVRSHDDPFDIANRPYDLTDQKLPTFRLQPATGTPEEIAATEAARKGDRSFQPLTIDFLGRVRGPNFSKGAAEDSADDNIFGLPRVE